MHIQFQVPILTTLSQPNPIKTNIPGGGSPIWFLSSAGEMYIYLSLKTTAQGKRKREDQQVHLSHSYLHLYTFSPSVSPPVFPQSTEAETEMSSGHCISGVLRIKMLQKSHRMVRIHAVTDPFISISVSTYAVLGFLMKPVFMKLGQRHDVLTPVLFKAASSSVKAL